ncbi:MAG: hypothetical protein ACI8XB_002475 [Patiriisocius sp.]|jgi:hypothetical protein
MDNQQNKIKMSGSSYVNEEKYLRARKKLDKLVGFYWHLAVYVLVNIFIIGMVAYAIEDVKSIFSFGTFSTAIFWGIGLFFHWLSVFGSNIIFGSRWEERKMKELMDKENKSWQ